MPVTTRIIVADSASSRRSKFTRNEPTEIQSEQVLEEQALALGRVEQPFHREHRHRERQRHHHDREPPGGLAQPLADEQVDHRAHERQQRDQPQDLHRLVGIGHESHALGYHRSSLASSTLTVARRR